MKFGYAHKDKNETILKLVSRHEHLVLFAAFFSLAVASRVIFQPLPSVDPLLPIILFAGAKLGKKEGALLGATAYYASNFFVVGGQGIWTIPMVIGAAGVGYCGAFFKNKYRGIIVGTVFYELVVNLLLAFMFNPLFALPFVVVHLISNIILVGLGKKVLTKFQGRSQASTQV